MDRTPILVWKSEHYHLHTKIPLPDHPEQHHENGMCDNRTMNLTEQGRNIV